MTKRFGTAPIFSALDADIHAGSVTALVGPNASGKTTLLRVLWGELKPEEGTIRWEGAPVDTASELWRRTVGAVPDDDALIEGLSIEDHFMLGGTLLGLTPTDIARRTGHLVELFGLEHAAATTRSADEASRGNRKRLACALALLGEPDIILMDEPYAGLDAERAVLLSTVLGVLAGRGRTVLFSCHDEGITRSVADRFLMLGSTVAVTGPLDQLPDTRRGYMLSSYGSNGGTTAPDIVPWLR